MRECKHQHCKGYYLDCNKDEYICLNKDNKTKDGDGIECKPMSKCNKTEECGYEAV